MDWDVSVSKTALHKIWIISMGIIELILIHHTIKRSIAYCDRFNTNSWLSEAGWLLTEVLGHWWFLQKPGRPPWSKTRFCVDRWTKESTEIHRRRRNAAHFCPVCHNIFSSLITPHSCLFSSHQTGRNRTDEGLTDLPHVVDSNWKRWGTKVFSLNVEHLQTRLPKSLKSN